MSSSSFTLRQYLCLQLKINDSTNDITRVQKAVQVTSKIMSEITVVTTFKASVVPTTSASERSPEPRSRSRPLTPTSDEALLGVPEPPPHLSRRNLWKVLACQYTCAAHFPFSLHYPLFLYQPIFLPLLPHLSDRAQELRRRNTALMFHRFWGYGTGALSAIQPGEITYWV